MLREKSSALMGPFRALTEIGAFHKGNNHEKALSRCSCPGCLLDCWIAVDGICFGVTGDA